MSQTLDATINLLAGTVRGWRGTAAFSPVKRRPETLLRLYDFEACPYCRLVREVLTELDFDVLVLPCPVGGERFRLEAERIGGKQQFPLLVDENTGTTLYESADIIDYLGRTYDAEVSGPRGLRAALDHGSSFVSSALLWRPSGFQGRRARPSRAAEKPLELYSFESSPFSKRVRARLCEPEIPYVLRNTGKAAWTDMGPPLFRDRLFRAPKGTSRHREHLAKTTGKVQVPYVLDPNTGDAMYESEAILAHLERTYAA